MSVSRNESRLLSFLQYYARSPSSKAIDSHQNPRWAVTGSVSIYLHALEKGVPDYRKPKDVDIYAFERLFDEQTPFYCPRQFYKDAEHARMSQPNAAGVALDLFSNSYIISRVPPTRSDVVYCKHLPTVPICSIEHSLILKLCMSIGQTDKDIADANFILQNFEIDPEKCKKIFDRTRHNRLELDKTKLQNGDIDSIQDRFRDGIHKIHENIVDDIELLANHCLWPLLHYDQFDRPYPAVRWPSNIAKKQKPVLRLGARFMSYGVWDVPAVSETLNCVIKSVRWSDPHANGRFLARCMYSNSLIRSGFKYETIRAALRKPNFLKTYFICQRELDGCATVAQDGVIV